VLTVDGSKPREAVKLVPAPGLRSRPKTPRENSAPSARPAPKSPSPHSRGDIVNPWD
jgi:hypothetical protein